MAHVLALLDDLFFQAKLVETARQTGVELQVAATPDALLAAASEQRPALVVVDLNARQNPLEAIAQLRAERPELRVIAFLSHVQTELAEQARAAGCTEVMPRSKFTKHLADILAQAKA